MDSPKEYSVPDLPSSSLPQVKEDQPPLILGDKHNNSAIAVKAELIEIATISCQEQKQQQFIKSIDDLVALSAVIDTFKRRYDELQNHVEFIQNAIDSKLDGVSSTVSPPQIDTQFAIAAADALEQPPQQTLAIETEAAKKSEAQRLCESMCSRGLRRYIASNLSDTAKLREEIPTALKLAMKPARLVLDCIGRFYLQGIKAYTHNSPMIPSRKACVLALECFLLMSGDCSDGEIELESSVKAEAESGAVAWRKRLVAEGGLRKADEIDARGLLLLVAGFVIPSSFRNEDLVELIRLCNPIEISVALRRSSVLVPRIPGIIEGLMKRGMHVEAVELVYTFDLADKFSPQTVLTSFLRMNKETYERAKRKAHSPIALKDASEKQLAALKSVVKCLETHKTDSAKFLPGWQIKEQMFKLEKDIADINKDIEEKARSKRRMEEIAFSDRLNNQEIKRSRFATRESPSATSSYNHMFNDQRFSSHGVRNDISALVNSYLVPSSSIPPHGSGLGSLHENVTATGPGSGISAYASGTTGYLATGSYSGLPGQSFSGQQTSFGLQRVYGQSQSVEGLRGLPNYSSTGNSNSDLYGYADAV